jgi:WD40 repeat protein
MLGDELKGHQPMCSLAKPGFSQHLLRWFVVVVGAGSMFLPAAAAQPPSTDTPTRKEGVWEITEIGKLRYHDAQGDHLVIGAEGQPPQLWDTAKGKRVAVLHQHKGALESAAFSPDGKRLLTAEAIGRPWSPSADQDAKLQPYVRSLFLWDTTTAKLLKRIDVDLGTKEFRSRRFWKADWLDHDTVLLQMSPRDTVLAALDVNSGKITRTATLNCGSLLLSPDRKWAIDDRHGGFSRDFDGGISRILGLSVIDSSDHVDLIDLRTFQVAARIYDSPEPTADRVWSPDSRWLATLPTDNTIHLWNTDKRKRIAMIEGHKDYILSMCFAPDGRTLVTASEDGTACLWETATGKLRATLTGHTAGLTHAVFDASGQRILTGGEDETARLWDATTGQLLRAFADHESGVRRVAFADDGKTMVTLTVEGIERTWSLADGSLLREKPLAGTLDSWYGVLLVKSGNNGAEIWAGPWGAVLPGTRATATGPRPRQTIRVHYRLGWVALAPDGKTMATSGG